MRSYCHLPVCFFLLLLTLSTIECGDFPQDVLNKLCEQASNDMKLAQVEKCSMNKPKEVSVNTFR